MTAFTEIEAKVGTEHNPELENQLLAALLETKNFGKNINDDCLEFLILNPDKQFLALKILNNLRKHDRLLSLQDLDMIIDVKFKKRPDKLKQLNLKKCLAETFKYRNQFSVRLFNEAEKYVTSNMRNAAEELFVQNKVEQATNLITRLDSFTLGNFDPNIMKIDNYMALEIPPLQKYLGCWFEEQSGTLIYGWRGSGKTWFVDCCIKGITQGKGFGPWACNNSVPCMIIDAELPAASRQARNRDLYFGNDKNMYLINVDYFTRTYPSLPTASLLNPRWRQWVMQMIERFNIKVLVLDNEGALTSGGKYDENNAADFSTHIGQFILTLRFKGVAVNLIHHSNKKREQSGTAVRERFMSNSINVKKIQTKDGGSFGFSYEFEKDRADVENQDDVKAGCFTVYKVNNKLKFDHTYGIDSDKRIKIIELLGLCKLTQKNIATELDINQSSVSRQKNYGLAKGMFELDDKGKIVGLSDKGQEYVGRFQRH